MMVNWKVIKIEDKGQVGKDIVIIGDKTKRQGGVHQTRVKCLWKIYSDGPLCTSDKTDQETGSVTGLPKEISIPFPISQFMDIDDRQIDLVKFLSENDELKPLLSHILPRSYKF